MSFKQSVVLLLNVAVLACSATEGGIIEFVEAPDEGAEIALQLAQDYIDEGGFDLILSYPEPLYGYDCGESCIAYMMFADPHGEVMNMEDYQVIKQKVHEAGMLFDTYAAPIIKENCLFNLQTNLGEEVTAEWKPLEEAIPVDVRTDLEVIGKREREIRLIIVGFMESGAEIIQASPIGGGIIGLYYPEEREGEFVGYGLTSINTSSVYSVFFSINEVFEVNDELTFPDNSEKPFYIREYRHLLIPSDRETP